MGSLEEPNEDTKATLRRFAGAFDLAFTRYEDLKRAEADAREAKIEAGLERARARTMAMQRSDELQDTSRVFCDQLSELSENFTGVYFALVNKENSTAEIWHASSASHRRGRSTSRPATDSLFNDLPYWPNWLSAWERGDTDVSFHITPDLYSTWMSAFPNLTQELEVDIEVIEAHYDNGWFQTDAMTRFGSIGATTAVAPFIDSEKAILVRFAKEFERTYARFLDLQKAEAAAREAQIEASLERVRAQTMAMQTSEELHDITEIVTQQLDFLGVRQRFVYLNLVDRERDLMIIHTCTSETHPIEHARSKTGSWTYPFSAVYSDLSFPYLDDWDNDSGFRRYDLGPEEFDAWYETFSEPMEFYEFDKESLRAVYPDGVFQAEALVGTGYLAMGGSFAYTEEEEQILHRFAKEFQTAYTRFRDILSAEEASREARIEAALERVRAASMAMHRSSEIGDVAAVMTTQMRQLEFDSLRRVSIAVVDDDPEYFWLYSASQSGQGNIKGIRMKSGDHPTFQDYRHNRPLNTRREHLYEGAVMENLNRLLTAAGWQYPEGESQTERFYSSFSSFEGGDVLATTYEPLSDLDYDVLDRFARVFDMTYKRFEDLKSAEAATQEAKIEAALERVRSASMAMHHSDEISEVARVLGEQLYMLDFPHFVRAAISTKDPDPAYFRYHASSRHGDYSYNVSRMAWEPLIKAFANLPEFAGMAEEGVWPTGRRILRYNEEFLPTVYRAMGEAGFNFDEADGMEVSQIVDHVSAFEGGVIHAITLEPLDEEHLVTLDRFAAVFGMAYQRFEELLSAEARANEARKDASVDRIRGEISTMRTAEDLERITPLMWQELKTLEIPFLRCGLLIADEKAQLVRFYPSHPDGRTLAAIVLPFGGAGIGDEALEAWRNRNVWKDVWDRDRFVQWTADMVAAGQIENPEDYYDGSEPPESIALQFVPFAQGMIYVGSPEPLEDVQIDVVQSLADAFAVAYARYDDFQTTEKALSDLKATQRQLVEQEKLASLGSLTAGIAHEIKNPLNFVNNFAEVGGELADELSEAIAAGRTEEAQGILAEMKTNSEQITKHGRRADSIVKAMMQHARGGESNRESIEVNDFLEEYANLAWHGARARDDSFQTELNRDFDPDTGSLNVMPQELGRVVLNLLNNAFDAVRGVDQAEVRISSTQKSGSVQISITDNGPGIPEDIREKIFEPFFTTKATGEGTGLGLSLSYDIVTKGHQGTMTASNRPEGGAVFTITLPIE